MENTNKVVLLIDRQIGIKIKDGATPDGDVFKRYHEGDDKNGKVAITVESDVWSRLEVDKHSPSDIETIRGQLRLQLGG